MGSFLLLASEPFMGYIARYFPALRRRYSFQLSFSASRSRHRASSSASGPRRSAHRILPSSCITSDPKSGAPAQNLNRYPGFRLIQSPNNLLLCKPRPPHSILPRVLLSQRVLFPNRLHFWGAYASNKATNAIGFELACRMSPVIIMRAKSSIASNCMIA